MSGGSFVRAIIFWLLMLAVGFMIVGASVFGESVVPLVVAFSIVWAVLTLWWAWKLGNLDD